MNRSCSLPRLLILAAALAVWSVPALAQDFIKAKVATSVADENEDGFGDNAANAIGPPALASAGVNLSGGPGTKGTVRFHMEFDISALEGPVSEAHVVLASQQGAIDTLDTLFFAATGDGDGEIEDSDFETPATQIPGVMLSVSGSPDDFLLFDFDVTSQLASAVSKGFDFFVVQGRVANEAGLVASSTPARGLQLFTTCGACGTDPDFMPQLVALTNPGGLEGCIPDDTVLCIDNQTDDRRFQVEASYETARNGGQSGDAQAVPLSPLGINQGGVFTFFDPTNPELFLKVLPACPINNSFWVFMSAGTDVGYEVKVTDTKTGITKTYTNEDGTPAVPVQDTSAFDCP